MQVTLKSPVAGLLEGFFPAPFCLSKIYPTILLVNEPYDPGPEKGNL